MAILPKLLPEEFTAKYPNSQFAGSAIHFISRALALELWQARKDKLLAEYGAAVKSGDPGRVEAAISTLENAGIPIPKPVQETQPESPETLEN